MEVVLTVDDGTDDLLRYFVSLDSGSYAFGETVRSGRVASQRGRRTW